jgi:hypothetical protein
MKKIKVKKLYKGFASIRSYIIQKCINEKKPLIEILASVEAKLDFLINKK